MYFHQNSAALPLELFCIRAAAGVETATERADLLAAWRLCLQHGPSSSRRRINKVAPARAGSFTKETAGVPMRRLEQLERCLEVMA